MTFETLLSLPKSFYVSWKLTSFCEAFHLPILVRHNCVLKNLSGRFVNKGCGKLFFGFGSVNIFDKTYERSILEIAGTLEINGQASFGHGSRLSIGKDGVISIGHNFENISSITIVCKKHITIGSNVLTSWNTLIMDTDLHPVRNTITNEVYNSEKAVKIGDNVWIGTRAIVLKGTSIPDGCIIGAGALVSKSFQETNSIIAGNPSKIIKTNVKIVR